MIEILDQQKKIELSPQKFNSFTKSAIQTIPESIDKVLTIAFVDDLQIKALNEQFRGKNSTTDVLSFPNETDEFDSDKNYLGDIVISAEQASRQAFENKLSLELEIKQLILHGILHLCGYDHETDNGEMNELELKLRDKLKIN
jgi:probable rRNA maturation factor